MATDVRTIEVFRPGTFRPMEGDAVTYSADDLKAIAGAYDAAGAPAPVVVGHPRTDDPAFGWARGFRYDDAAGRLVADIERLEPAFADAVAAGRYAKISLSLFRPDAPNNPKPGAWYPKHIAFLGAAAPAVSGLKPVAFASAEGSVTFEFADAGALRDVARLFRSMREWIIEKFGIETADRALDGWSIGWIAEAAERDPPEPLRFAAPAPSPTPQEKPVSAMTEAALAEREKKLAERERAASTMEAAAFCETLIAEGRLLPTVKDKAVALLVAASAAPGEASFAENGATRSVPVGELMRDLLSSMPQAVSFGHVDTGHPPGTTAEFVAPDGYSADPASLALHGRALAFQAANPGSDYMTAVSAVIRA